MSKFERAQRTMGNAPPPRCSPLGAALGARASCPLAARMAAVPGEGGRAEWHSRGYLPHRDRAGLLQSISFRLHDAVPAAVLGRWKAELAWSEQVESTDPRAAELRRRIEHYEDAGSGACWLRDPAVAGVVQQALLFFDAQRYCLLEWCIMPNHVHVLIEEIAPWRVGSLAHSWKSYSAKEANRLLGRAGRFWMPDYFDRFTRNETHLDAVVEYIRRNPVNAGLCRNAEEWPFGSACVGPLLGARASCPLAAKMAAVPGEDAAKMAARPRP